MDVFNDLGMTDGTNYHISIKSQSLAGILEFSSPISITGIAADSSPISITDTAVVASPIPTFMATAVVVLSYPRLHGYICSCPLSYTLQFAQQLIFPNT